MGATTARARAVVLAPATQQESCDRAPTPTTRFRATFPVAMPHPAFQWFNEPAAHERPAPDALAFDVTAKTDYWRRTHYGFTVDDGPFAYVERGGEFVAEVCVEADWRARFDQAGLLVRAGPEHWVKCGVEYVGGRVHLSAVATREYSDWSVTPLDDVPKRLWFRAERRADALTVSYSRDGAAWEMLRLAYLRPACPVRVGVYAACPEGEGFPVWFTGFAVGHLPDEGRERWLARG